MPYTVIVEVKNVNVKEAAKRAGTSVRAMRYYEEIGLICPNREENGYREYTQEDIDRIKLIRAYRELEFSLDEIRRMLNASRAERDAMLERKIGFMENKRKQIENRIALARFIRMMGPERLIEIDFSQIDDQMEQSRKHIDENEEIKSVGERLRCIPQEEGDAIAANVIEHFVRIANAPESEIDQAMQNLIDLIDKHLYPCTDEILIAYARAYGGDGILAQAVDEAGGEGTSKRIRKRIEDWLGK